ncbi:hypothetical protein GQ600_24106 [Phytophthora cactorum]|nr:hypothetical protein GQ600_24106 [Phytophthora cactorum]
MEDKAIAHMAAMAPLAGVLHLATTELETEREALQHRIEVLRRENAALKLQSDRRKGRADEAEAQLAAMGESFRLHLERLVAMREKQKQQRESAEITIQKDINPSNSTSTTIRNKDPEKPETEMGDVDSSSSDSLSSAALVTGLDAVASKSQHEEIKRLKEQVQDAGRIPEELAEQHAKQTRDLAELREAHEQLQQRVADTEHMVIVQQQRREDMATRLRLVAGEVRQYLRLVRGEIKRKFGYLPEAIAHAESWARIAEALELLLCQSSDRCVARGRGNGK